MGLFFAGDEERFIPGVRKAGFPRYKEVLEGSWKEFFFVGFLTLLYFIPFAAGMVYAVLSKSALFALASGLVGAEGVTGINLVYVNFEDDPALARFAEAAGCACDAAGAAASSRAGSGAPDAAEGE